MPFACLLRQFQHSTASDQSLQHHKTLGALDMGGVSTEMTFVPENASAIQPHYRTSVQLHGEEYEMYSHSYQCYGLNEGYRRYLAHLVQVCRMYYRYDIFC